MSWESAKKEAQMWLDRLNLATKKMQGQQIDLNNRTAGLERFEPKFRTMVIRAAKRLLADRGVMAIIDEPQPPGQHPDSGAGNDAHS